MLLVIWPEKGTPTSTLMMLLFIWAIIYRVMFVDANLVDLMIYSRLTFSHSDIKASGCCVCLA